MCGILVSALPPPGVNMTFSGYSIAGQTYTLQCSASVVAGLVVLPDMKIVSPNSTVISVMNSSSVEYVFSPLRTSHGGKYTCTATVNIHQAGITDRNTSVTKTVFVVCKQKNTLALLPLLYNACSDAYPVGSFEGSVLEGTTFNFSWRPPSIAAHLTTGYNLNCPPLLAGIPAPETLELLPTATTAAVTDLFHGVTYNCSITTVSGVGASEPQTVILTTAKSSKYFHKRCIVFFLFHIIIISVITSTLSCSREVCSRCWRETSCFLLVSSTSDPA